MVDLKIERLEEDPDSLYFLGSRRGWTEQELRDVCELLRLFSVEEVARFVGRTDAAVRLALKRRHISIRALRKGSDLPAVPRRARCPECGDQKQIDDFTIHRNGHGSLTRRSICKACARSRAEKSRFASRLKYRFGLSVQDYHQLVDKQGGSCAICCRDDVVLCVDHDRNCCSGERSCGRCVRGLLCRTCNHLVGWLESYPQATSYLAKGVQDG